MWKMRAILRKQNLGGVDVGNVEVCLSSYWREVFSSLYETNSSDLPRRRVPSDVSQLCAVSRTLLERRPSVEHGLLQRAEEVNHLNDNTLTCRFNVAITRAKELLVVVGNANLLKVSHSWNSC